MKRRPYIIGFLAAGLTLTAAFGTPGYGQLVSSAASFQQHFHDLQSAGSALNPIERLVYSLILSNRHSAVTPKHVSPAEPRT